MSAPFVPTSRRAPLLVLAAALFAGVVTLDWASQLEHSLGVLYILPVLVAGLVLNRWQVVAIAVVSALVQSTFTPRLQPAETLSRFVMAVLAYSGIGVLAGEITRHRRAMAAAFGRLTSEETKRHEAEEQLRELAESSPAAILTLGVKAEVLMANRAAHELLGYEPPAGLIGAAVDQQLPVFAAALRVRHDGPMLRTSTTGWARKKDGEPFPVSMWFSTYGKGETRRVAGIVVDTSEDVRDREREAFRHLAGSNRLLASAVSHEIRNLSSAIRVVSSNLTRAGMLEGNADLTALGTLAESLARIASFDLSQQRADAGSASVEAVLGQLRLVIEPDWTDVGGELRWAIAPNLPAVRADEHALLQVFLNLAQNSLRAVSGRAERVLRITASADPVGVRIMIEDSGPGISNASTLFQPFREGSSGSGLGLFISRNLVRSFAGELSHVPAASGCRFDVVLPSAVHVL